jgi:hypothetical protein
MFYNINVDDKHSKIKLYVCVYVPEKCSHLSIGRGVDGLVW